MVGEGEMDSGDWKPLCLCDVSVHFGKGGDASHRILTAEATKQTEEATPELANNIVRIRRHRKASMW